MAEAPFYGELLARLHAEAYCSHATSAARRIEQLLGGRRPEVVVDLGCGPGDLLAVFSRDAATLVGVDRSPALLAYAAERAPGARLTEGSIYDVELPARIDLLCAVGEVVQYGPDGRAGLEALRWLCHLAAERLNPGGLLAFDLVTPGRAGPSGRRRLERDHGQRSVVVESVEMERNLHRTITTTEHGSSEVEVHVQVTVTPEEAEQTVAEAGLAVAFIAADYDGSPIDATSSSVAIVAQKA